MGRFRIARVDQMETAIGKSITDKEKNGKKDKIIRRELTAVLTGKHDYTYH